MNRFIIPIFAIFVLLSNAACASYPVSRVTQGSQGGAIALLASPVGAEVLVNGISYGQASQYDGRNAVLYVEPGRHLIALVEQGRIIFEREVYVGSSAVLELNVR